MKKLIPVLLCIVFAGCRKNYIDDQVSSEPVKMETIGACSDEVWGCIIPNESEFPGGMAAWQKFIYQHLTYPEELLDASVQGTVFVRFIVNANGEVSDVEVVKGPEELRQSAVDVVKKSPRWNPALINGRAIKSYKTQPINFRLEDE